jgi:hypothetical protein
VTINCIVFAPSPPDPRGQLLGPRLPDPPASQPHRGSRALTHRPSGARACMRRGCLKGHGGVTAVSRVLDLFAVCDHTGGILQLYHRVGAPIS